MSKDVIIVGAGLGGLLCGHILGREGHRVRLLEARQRAGGVLDGFSLDGFPCECGFHSVGGLGPGEPLDKLFRLLDLRDLPWYQVAPDEGFPFLRLNSGSELEMSHIVEPFRQSVWRLQGGGRTLVDALSEGLDIQYGATVCGIENKTVICEDGSAYRADVIISDLSPLTTLELVKDHIRPSWGHRIRKLENGPEIFSVHCLLENGSLPWQDGAVFLDGELMLHLDAREGDCARILELMRFGEGNPEEMIAKAKRRFPTFRVLKYVSHSFPGYGIKKFTAADYIAPRTPLPWLFLTGQNLGLHGILGTAVTALNTCKSIEL